MSYDLTVHLKCLNDSIIPKWLAEITKFNMDIDVHPDFSFSNHSGFLPFRFVVYDCPNITLNNNELMSGYELYVSPYQWRNEKKSIFSKLFRKQKEVSEIESKLIDADTEVTFNISAQDSFEYRLGWYSAASLAKVCNGVLTDLQEGVHLDGEQAIKHAYVKVIEDEKLLIGSEWKIHKSKDWLG
ncbi:hypothetical protein ACFQZR_05390 [Paenibacillus sp. GCM10027629]|uniref:hypothetical protein n=1 Tax=Paenibacillus sp. GCM10027629 TaxID=3273414 RepID=UPI0036274DFA